MHAEIARELLRSHDPLRLTLNGVRYVDKPALLYVLLAGAIDLGGPSEAAARAVPALAAVAAVAATAWLGARLLGDAAGLLAGVALLTSGGFFAYGRYVRPETLFVAALVTGLALVLVGVCRDARGLVVAGWAAVGLAGVAKDPLGVVAPPVVVGVALALGGRARPLRAWLPPGGVALLAALGLGWWALAAVVTPGFSWYTIVDNHVLNILRARHFPDADVPLSAVEFLAVSVLGAAPWAFAAVPTVWRLARRRAWRDPDELPWVALALWAVAVIGLVALSPFRLPHYGLPAYPALALLAARAWVDGAPTRLVSAHAALFAALALACGAGWARGPAFADGVLDITDVSTRKGGLGGSGLGLGAALHPLVGAAALVFALGAVALFAVLAARVRDRRAGAVVVAATLLALMPVVGSALGAVATSRAVKGVALAVARRAGPADVLVLEGPIEDAGALEWYGGRRPVIVDGRVSVLAFGATRPDARDVFWSPERLAAAWRGPARVWIVTARPPERSRVGALGGARLVTEVGGRRLYVNR